MRRVRSEHRSTSSAAPPATEEGAERLAEPGVDDPNRPPSPISEMDRQLARSFVEHRFKAAITGMPDPQAAMTLQDFKVKELTARVLQRELQLLKVQIEHAEEDVLDLTEDQDTLVMSIERTNYMASLFKLKADEASQMLPQLDKLLQQTNTRSTLSKCGKKERSVRSQLVEALRSLAETGGFSEQQLEEAERLLSLHCTEEDRSADGNEVGLSTEDSDESSLPLEVLRWRAEVHRALVTSLQKCVTNRVVDLLHMSSDLALAKRKLDFERLWCREAAEELKQMQEKIDAVQLENAERQRQLEIAKMELEAAHKNVFSLRKAFTIVHKRLMGLEPLPNGESLNPAACQPMVEQIRRELQQTQQGAKRTATLEHLAATDCAELAAFGRSRMAGDLSQQGDRLAALRADYSSSRGAKVPAATSGSGLSSTKWREGRQY